MKRKWFMPLGLLVVTVVFAGITQSCMHRRAAASQTLESDVTRVQTIVRVFRRLIGRDPSQAEIQSNLPTAQDYGALVRQILGSKAFEQDGFYNLNRERLALNREGSAEWLRNSYDDFCSLKLEMSDLAREDRSGKGFWETLRYKERWIRLASLEGFGEIGTTGCYLGTTIDDLVKAYALIEAEDDDGDPSEEPQAPATLTEQVARRCVEALPWSLFSSEPDPPAKLRQFMTALGALPAAERAKNFASRPEGEAYLVNQIRMQLRLVDFGAEEGGGEPLKLVKDGDRIVAVREQGTTSQQQCRFAPIALEQFAWRPSDLASPFDLPTDDAPTASGPADQPVLRADGGPLTVKADGSVYVKVEMPTLPGLHANPYWLARHPTKLKNKHLHRARAMYFSYFCAEINPDAANFSGGPVDEVPAPLRPFFDVGDVHAQGSSNCFNCHAKIQPIANFFGRLSWGRDYAPSVDSPAPPDLSPIGRSWAEFMDLNAPFDRPGGIWEGSAFFSMDGGPDRGPAGLAHAMSRYPLAKSCIVDATWAALVGRESPLFDEERRAALTAFEPQGQPASVSRLVDHFMTQNERGVAYFSKGEPAFAAIRPVTGYVCPEAPDEVHKSRVMSTLEGPVGKCTNCHSGEFFTSDNKFSIDYYFDPEGGGMDEDSPSARGRLVHNLYCRLFTNKMPPPSTGANLDQQTRGDAWCYFMRMRDRLAEQGTIPLTFKGKSCPVPAPQAMSTSVHEVGPEPDGP